MCTQLWISVLASQYTVTLVAVDLNPSGLAHYSVTSHRLRCHVLESIKPTVSPLRNSLPETGTNEQQELNTVVSSGGRDALLL